MIIKLLKTFLLFAFVVLTASTAQGQAGLFDVVHLKNGNVFKGEIIKDLPGESLTLKTAEGNIYTFKYSTIKKVKRNKVPYEYKVLARGNGLIKGTVLDFQLSSNISTAGRRFDRVHYLFSAGHQFNPHLFLGAGTGYHQYFDISDNFFLGLIPVYGSFRLNFLDRKISPFFALKAGYTLDPLSRFTPVGWWANSELGLSTMVNRTTAIYIGLGYNHQRVRPLSDFTAPLDLGAIGINVGVLF